MLCQSGLQMSPTSQSCAVKMSDRRPRYLDRLSSCCQLTSCAWWTMIPCTGKILSNVCWCIYVHIWLLPASVHRPGSQVTCCTKTRSTHLPCPANDELRELHDYCYYVDDTWLGKVCKHRNIPVINLAVSSMDRAATNEHPQWFELCKNTKRSKLVKECLSCTATTNSVARS